jgi:N-acetyl-anhydromuramyl-L-alanine amidase AmpD
MEILKSINNETTPTRPLEDIKAVIVHHTGDNSLFANLLKYLNKTDNISAHYLVSKLGEIYQLVDDNHIAYHAGVSAYTGLEVKNNSLNWCTLGIEVQSDGNTFTEAQRGSVRWLITHLVEKYNIPLRYVLRHKDIAPQRKWDIGDNFFIKDFPSWKDYQNSLNKEPPNEKLNDAITSVVYALKTLWHSTEDERIKTKASECVNVIRNLKR